VGRGKYSYKYLHNIYFKQLSPLFKFSPSSGSMVEPLRRAGWSRFLNFGLEFIEARRMDHNDLHVLDFGKLYFQMMSLLFWWFYIFNMAFFFF